MENCRHWAEEVFVPFAKARRVDPLKPIILTMDGHDTHEKHDLKHALYGFLDREDLEIIVFCFPSKTTHKCQPLDVLIFSTVDYKWQEICDTYSKRGEAINRFNVIPAYIHGTQAALTKDLIAKSFEKTGLYPVNRSVFTPDDFAPSKASSSIAYVPETFPDDFPSSDPIDHSDDDQSSDSGSDSSDSNFMITTDDGLCCSAEECHSKPSDITDNVELEDVEDPVDAMPQEPFSRFLATYANLESQVAHMTHSISARHNLHTVEPPKIVSLKEDCKLSHEDLLKELQSVRQQLQYTYQACGCALGLLSAANAHCTMVCQELSTVRI